MNEFKQNELNLFKQYKKGDKTAKKQLLFSLTPLITSQVNKFSTSGLPVPAIKLEGQRLASQAIDTYNPKKSQLNTHVTNYLKKLSRFVTTYQNVGHIPEPRALMIGQYNTVYTNLETDKNRPPTVQELADAMSVSTNEIDRLQTELRKDLSQQLKNDDEDDTSGFFEYIAPEQSNTKLNEVLDFVYFDSDATNKKILEYTFGMFGNMKLSPNDICMRLGITANELKKRKDNLAQEIKKIYV